MNKLILFLVLIGACNATEYYGSLQENTTYPTINISSLNSTDCVYLFADDTLITIPNVITMMSGGIPIGYSYRFCASNLTVLNIINTTILNTTVVNTTIINNTIINTTVLNVTENNSCSNIVYKVNITSPKLWFNQNWTEPNSNVTCLGADRLTSTLNVASGNSYNNYMDTGITINGPSVTTCPICAVCPEPIVCPVCETCYKLNGNYELSYENTTYINPNLNGSVFFKPKTLATLFATNGSCNSTSTLAGTNISYCPSMMLGQCLKEDKDLGNLEGCVNKFALDANDSYNNCEVNRLSCEKKKSDCESGEADKKQKREDDEFLAALLIFIVGGAVLLAFWMKRKKEGD